MLLTRALIIECLLALIFLAIPCNIFSQSIDKADNTFQMDFADGFKNANLKIMDSSSKKVVFKQVLNSDRVLGFAGSCKVVKGRKYFILVNNRSYSINTARTRYAYINYFHDSLTITYTDRKKLYQ